MEGFLTLSFYVVPVTFGVLAFRRRHRHIKEAHPKPRRRKRVWL